MYLNLKDFVDETDKGIYMTVKEKYERWNILFDPKNTYGIFIKTTIDGQLVSASLTDSNVGEIVVNCAGGVAVKSYFVYTEDNYLVVSANPSQNLWGIDIQDDNIRFYLNASTRLPEKIEIIADADILGQLYTAGLMEFRAFRVIMDESKTKIIGIEELK